MLLARRLLFVAAVAALLCSVAFVAGYALRDKPATHPSAAGSSPEPPDETVGATPPLTTLTPPPRHTSTPRATPEPTPKSTPKPKPTPRPTPSPTLEPGPRLLGPGDDGDEVRDLQARLKQIAWFNADLTGYYGDVTTTAVRGFQAKREIPVTGEVDRRTLDRLHAMTTEPTRAELTNQVVPTNEGGTLDSRCRTGRVLCIDKSTSTLRWVVDGKVLQTLDVRFGASYSPTREGVFSVYTKDADHVSQLYGSEMPYSMFFSGGQAVHYSSDFAARGYDGASHGCVNVRDYEGIKRLYDQVSIGDRVVIYWS